MAKKINKDKKEKTKQINSSDQWELYYSIINYKYLPILFAILYMIILSYLCFTYHKIGGYGTETDFYWSYVPSAKAFLKGEFLIDAFRGPLYQIVLGIFGFVIGEYLKAGMVINILSAAAVIFLTMTIVRKLFSNEYAFFTGLLLAVNPIFIQFTYSVGTDMLFNALACTAIYFMFSKEEYNLKYLILASLITGLAYLTRYNGTFLLILFFFILLINFWEIDLKKRIKSAIIFFGVFFITITPWGIYLLIKKGSFFYNDNYKNIAYELYGKGKIAWDSFWFSGKDNYSSILDVILKDPLNFVIHMFKNIYEHFYMDIQRLMGLEIGVFVCIGIIVFIINNPLKYIKSKKFAFLTSGGVFFLILLLVFYSERFSIFLIPFYSIIAIYPLLSNGRSIKKLLPKYVIVIILVVVSLFSFTRSYSFNDNKIYSGPNEILKISNWYNNNVPLNERGKKIAARKPHIAYYLNMDFYLIPLVNNYAEFLDIIKRDKVDYIFFSYYEAKFRPALMGLLNPNYNFPGIIPIYYNANPPAVLYKVE